MGMQNRLGAILALAWTALGAAGCAGRALPEARPAGVPATELLPAAPGWRAEVVLDLGQVGIWTVEAVQLLDQYAAPEIIALDDRGRCHVVVGYSGRYGGRAVVHDGTWLGALARGEVDPGVAGPELYVGSQAGNVFQVLGHPDGLVEGRRVARLPGHQIHTLVAANLDPTRPGDELLAFTEPAALFLLTPGAAGFEIERLGAHHGRVRDAKLLPGLRSDGGARVVLVSRSGRLESLESIRPKPRFSTLFELDTGIGRLALAPDADAERVVLYSAADDGRIHRHEGPPEGPFLSELIYAGPLGPRGLAAGRFHADPKQESIAVFGYGTRVELLVRKPSGRWEVEATLFQDRGGGHWLAAAELDGRNGTDELLLSGFGGRVVLLSREPGYGLGVAADPHPDARGR